MKRLPGLDLLRAIAIIWVMLFHSWVVGGLGDRFSFLGDFGWMGVDLFFVLSGYLIGSQLLRPLSRGESFSFSDFYLRRAFRVLPAFLVVLALYLFWPAFREAPGMQPAWQFMTFTLNFLIDYAHNQAFSHAWSLCVEEHFYLLAPLLAWWLTRQPSLKKFATLCIAIVIGGMILRGVIWMHALAPVRTDEDLLGLRYLQDIYYPTYTRLDGLLFGVVLASIQTYRSAWWARIQHWSNGLMLAGLLLVGGSIWLCQHRVDLLPSIFSYPLIAAGMAALVTSATSSKSWLGRIRIPGMHWIALTSYSMYLSHKAALHLVNSALSTRSWFHGLSAFFIYTAAVFAVGALLYYTVERPFLRLRTRLQTTQAVKAVVADTSPTPG